MAEVYRNIMTQEVMSSQAARVFINDMCPENAAKMPDFCKFVKGAIQKHVISVGSPSTIKLRDCAKAVVDDEDFVKWAGLTCNLV